MQQVQNEARDEVMRLFIKNQDMVSGYLYALVRDWDVVDDSMQETSVYLCNHWDEFKVGTNFCAWLRVIAHMRCREVLALKKRGEKLLIKDFETVATSLTYTEWDDKKSSNPPQTQVLDLCIKSLPEDQRRLIEMIYKEGHATVEIARKLEKTQDALYQAISRIRKRLKMCMERRLSEEGV